MKFSGILDAGALRTQTKSEFLRLAERANNRRKTKLNGAQERTRTSTPLRELAPEASASANSATWASPAAKQRGPTILQRDPGFVNEAQPQSANLDPRHGRRLKCLDRPGGLLSRG